MLKVAIYPSNHGYGHASRMSALAEELNKFNVFSFIRTNRPAFLFSNLDPRMYQISETTTDFGVVHGGDLTVELQATKNKLIDLMQRRREIVDREVQFLSENQIDCVISDIPFLIIEAASYAKIPVVAISNFDWTYIYRDLFNDDRDMVPILNCIEGIYRRADVAIRLPFSSSQSFSSFDQKISVGLLARKKDTYLDIRRELSIDSTHKIILSIESGVDTIDLWMDSIAQCFDGLIITNRQDCNYKNVVSIDPKVDIVDYIKAADAILTKPGYGIFSEGIQFGKPFILRTRVDYPEDKILINYLRKHVPVLMLVDKQNINYQCRDLLTIPQSSGIKNNNQNIAHRVYALIINLRTRGSEMVSVFDIGSNNLNYTVYDKYSDQVVHRHQLETGLGIGIHNRSLRRDGICRFRKALTCIRAFDRTIKSSKKYIGTEALRTVKNAEVVRSLVSKGGGKLEVITPREEARLVFETVVDNLELSTRTLAIDIGGRSCEFVRIAKKRLAGWISFPYGLQSFRDEDHNSILLKLDLAIDMNMLDCAVDQIVIIGLTAEIIGDLCHSNVYFDQRWGRLDKKSLESIQRNIDCQIDSSQKLVFHAIQLIVLVLDKYRVDEVWLCNNGISVGYAKWFSKHKGKNEVLY